MSNEERKAIQKRIEILKNRIFIEQMAEVCNFDWIYKAEREIKELEEKLNEN